MANAILRMIVGTQHLEETAAAISKLPEVIWVAKLTGEYNLMADLTCVSMDHLRKFLEEVIGKMKGIRQTDLAIYLKYYKSDVVPDVRLLRRVAQSDG
jgi:DNA-binding Lrp family transcriptional regulator